MHKVAVLDDYQQVADRLVDWSVLGSDVEVRIFHDHLDEKELIAAIADMDVVLAMRERTPFQRRVLEQLPNLKLLATTGMGNAAIDLVAAEEFGILVSGTPSGLPSTIEIAWALILGTVKRLPLEDRGVRSGHWQQHLPGDLAGKRLGLIGLGRLGSAMVPIARAFSMDIVAWSQNLTVDRTEALGIELVAKEDLLRQSDVVSIHLRLSDRTRGLIGTHELSLMSPNAVLINTSRGPIVDEQALVAALSTNVIRGAGLDVFDIEPVACDHPLVALENVVLTPHLGYASEANLLNYFGNAVENIAAFFRGTPQRLLHSESSMG